VLRTGLLRGKAWFPVVSSLMVLLLGMVAAEGPTLTRQTRGGKRRKRTGAGRCTCILPGIPPRTLFPLASETESLLGRRPLHINTDAHVSRAAPPTGLHGLSL
jgi:hypothetical protein